MTLGLSAFLFILLASILDLKLALILLIISIYIFACITVSYVVVSEEEIVIVFFLRLFKRKLIIPYSEVKLVEFKEYFKGSRVIIVTKLNSKRIFFYWNKLVITERFAEFLYLLKRKNIEFKLKYFGKKFEQEIIRLIQKNENEFKINIES